MHNSTHTDRPATGPSQTPCHGKAGRPRRNCDRFDTYTDAHAAWCRENKTNWMPLPVWLMAPVQEGGAE